MTSAINTGGIDVNYPIPGQNNSSQGFRDNFAAIKTSLETGANEITDIQNKAIFKSALDGTILDNNMANALISNASTRGFRASTFNLGNDLSGSVIINVSLGDVQYGTVTANTLLQFTGWAPVGTQSNVQLQLFFANNEAVLSFPTEVKINGSSGATSLENYANIGNVVTVTVPSGTNVLDYRLSTLDCGNNITIEPFNRPRVSTQIQLRTPSPVGFQGDTTGTFTMDQSTALAFATVTSIDGEFNILTCNSTAGWYLDMPVVFTGIAFGGVSVGATYYIRTIISSTQFTISTMPGNVNGPGQIVNLLTDTGIMNIEPVSYLYASSGDYDGTITTKYATSANIVTTTVQVSNTCANANTIAVTSVAGFKADALVGFGGSANIGFAVLTDASGNITVNTTNNMVVGGRFLVESGAFGGMTDGTFYYIQNIDSANSNIKLAGDYYNAVSNTNTLLWSSTIGNSSVSWNNLMGGLILQNYYIKDIEPTVTVGNLLISRNYTITSNGTTNWTAIGSPSNAVGTTFTANASGLVQAGSFTAGANYVIGYVGTTNWTAIGATSNTPGIQFTATGVGTGNGLAAQGNGQATALNQFTVSTIPGGETYQLVSENGSGSMLAATVTDFTLTLNSTTGLETNQPVIFNGTTFGGVFSNTLYYISNIVNGTNISISSTLYNGISGQKLPLTNGNGNMRMDVYTGTNIWKSVPLKPIGSVDDGSAIGGDLVVYGNALVYGTTILSDVTGDVADFSVLSSSDFTVSGNANLSANSVAYNLSISNNLSISSPALFALGGGTNGFVLQTDGAGNLSWTAQTGSGTGAPGGTNTQIQFNDNSLFNGSANLTFNKSTNTLFIGNTLSVGGNANIGNIGTTGLITATGNITGGNLVTGGKLSVTGNANIGNIGTAGLITATGNINGANIVTAGLVSATGNIVGGNLSTTGTLTVGTFSLANLTATGNVDFTATSNVKLGAVGNVKITGGTNGYILSTDGAGNLSWVVKPNSGSAVITAIISGATQANPGVITTSSAHNLPEKALVTITDVVGMTQLNGNSYYANVLTGTTFSLYSDITLSTPVDTTGFGAYVSGGNITSTINGTGVGVAGGANTQVQFNNSGYVGGSAGFTFDKSSNIFSTPGNISAVGTVTAGNLITAGTMSAAGNANVGNLSTQGQIVAVGNIGAGNITTSGNVTTPNVVNGTSGIILTPSGNININIAGNPSIIRATSTGANVNGYLSVSGNANVGNIGATSAVFAGALTGITTITGNGNIATTNSLISGQYVRFGSNTAISANGIIQADATQLANAFNVISTVGSGANNSVKLPSAQVGLRVMVRNNSANTLYVWPYATQYINSSAGSFTMGPLTTNEFFCADSSNWYSINP